MAGISNTSRTIGYLRGMGWTCCVAERWIKMPKHPAGGFRKDLFGFGDLVALGEKSIIGVQSCGQDFAAHDKKILEDEEVAPNVLKWLECPGGRVMLIGWRKIKKKRGGKAKIWSPRIKEYSVADFSDDDNARVPLGESAIDVKYEEYRPRVRVKEGAMIGRWDLG